MIPRDKRTGCRYVLNMWVKVWLWSKAKTDQTPKRREKKRDSYMWTCVHGDLKTGAVEQTLHTNAKMTRPHHRLSADVKWLAQRLLGDCCWLMSWSLMSLSHIVQERFLRKIPIRHVNKTHRRAHTQILSPMSSHCHVTSNQMYCFFPPRLSAAHVRIQNHRHT